MNDTRAFLTAGFRSRVKGNAYDAHMNRAIARNPEKVCLRVVCGKGKVYAEYKNFITGKVWKEEV